MPRRARHRLPRPKGGITTLRAPTIRKLVNAGTVTPSLFDERDLAEVTSEESVTARGAALKRRGAETEQFPMGLAVDLR